MPLIYDDTKKDLPSDQLHKLFVSVGWSDGLDTQSMIDFYNVPFINSTLVISAWQNERLVGVVRVLSDKVFRSVIYDLIVTPGLQNKGIGTQLVKRCIGHFPNSEWLVETTKNVAEFYEKIGFTQNASGGDAVFLSIPCKLFTRTV